MGRRYRRCWSPARGGPRTGEGEEAQVQSEAKSTAREAQGQVPQIQTLGRPRCRLHGRAGPGEVQGQVRGGPGPGEVLVQVQVVQLRVRPTPGEAPRRPPRGPGEA